MGHIRFLTRSIESSVASGTATLSTPVDVLAAGSAQLTLNPFTAVPHASSYQSVLTKGGVAQSTTTPTTAGTVYSGLTNGTAYVVSLQAIGNGTTYLNSATAFATATPATAVVLSTPTDALAVGNTQITLNPFTAVTHASSYTSVLSLGGVGQSTTTPGTAGTAYTGLTNGTAYVVSLQAIGNGTTYLNSATAFATATPAATTLSTPTDVLTAGSAQITLNAFSAVPNASSYQSILTPGGTYTPTTSGTTWTGLANGTSYVVSLQAIGNGTTYLNSATALATATPFATATTLGTPVCALTAGTSLITLNAFTAVPNASSYKSIWTNGGTAIGTATPGTAGMTITGLTGGTAYVFSLQAIGNGTTYLSGATAFATATPLAPTLSTPTDTLTVGNTQLTLNSFSAIPNASSYKAVLYQGATDLGTVTPTTAGTVIGGLTNGTAYVVSLQAIGNGTNYLNSATAFATATPTTASWYIPGTATIFQWEISNPFVVTNAADMGTAFTVSTTVPQGRYASGVFGSAIQPTLYDIDMFTAVGNGSTVASVTSYLGSNPNVIAELHTLGYKVCAYIDIGTFEPGRGDSNNFPAALKGDAVSGWPGEYWLNVNPSGADYATLQAIMLNRFEMAAAAGFDFVEGDNIDGYQAENTSGFNLTEAECATYDIWCYEQIHSLGMGVFQKNGSEQIATLEPYADALLYEEGFYYGDISPGGSNLATPYINAGKCVIDIEYISHGGGDISLAKFEGYCPGMSGANAGIQLYLMALNLDATCYVQGQ